jgi:Family of unknown function (DUF6286)
VTGPAGSRAAAGGPAVTESVTAQPAPPIPRGRRVTPAVIVAACLLITAVTVTVQAIFVYAKGSPWLLDGPAIVDRLQEIPWRHWGVVTAAAVLTLLGLWLLILAFAPASPTVVELREPDPSMSTGITPGGLRRALVAAATRVDGVSGATAHFRRGTATMTVTTPLRHHEMLPAAVTSSVTDRLAQLDPVRGYSVQVRIVRRESR